jgi:Fe-S oxidoreductase
MCLHVCPVFDAERKLTVSPSVKSRLAYFSEEDIFEAIYHCLPCDSCKNACPMEISVDEVLIKFRVGGEVAEKARIKFERRVESINFDEERTGSVLYFPGCRSFDAGIVRTSIEVLEKLNVDFAVQKEVICCGMPYYELGFIGEFRDRINRLKEVANNYDGVISNCPHCVHIMRQNGIKATHILSVLQPVKTGGDISYHDPCILARRLGVVDEPRIFLKQMGFDIHEPLYHGKDTHCCGYGGIYPLVDERMAEKISEKRKKQFDHEIVTACPTCKKALNGKDIVELVVEGI